jgi:two-component system cell cycle sensor histidine kinase/response regulator CckA
MDLDLAMLSHSQWIASEQFEGAVIVRDLDDRIVFWNKGAERLYGWAHDEAISQNYYDLLFPPGLKSRGQQWTRRSRTGEWIGELRQVTKSRQTIIVESRWIVQQNKLGETESVLMINRDITEKRILEKAILHAQRIETISTLTCGLAHDLNNVLSTLLILIRRLRQSRIEFEGQNLLESSQFQAEHLARMITQLLSLGKDGEEEFAPVDVGELIGKTGKIINDVFPEAIVLKTAVSEDLKPVLGNSTQLYHLLLNLSLNARDAMPDGGVLNIGARNVTVEEGIGQTHDRRAGEYVVVTVTDTGVGIPPEIKPRICEPFFTTNQDKGAGLGLFAVDRIVKKHCGMLKVVSEPNQGTEFQIYLPVEWSVCRGQEKLQHQ